MNTDKQIDHEEIARFLARISEEDWQQWLAILRARWALTATWATTPGLDDATRQFNAGAADEIDNLWLWLSGLRTRRKEETE